MAEPLFEPVRAGDLNIKHILFRKMITIYYCSDAAAGRLVLKGVKRYTINSFVRVGRPMIDACAVMEDVRFLIAGGHLRQFTYIQICYSRSAAITHNGIFAGLEENKRGIYLMNGGCGLE